MLGPSSVSLVKGLHVKRIGRGPLAKYKPNNGLCIKIDRDLKPGKGQKKIKDKPQRARWQEEV